MKNLNKSKLSREQLKGISGNGIVIDGKCSRLCCPPPGIPRCSGMICPTVVCPEY
ncbi:hypothetical protein [Chryseobacterium sp. Tr-659]|uniref:hypothetical protein n=1 Tax=Chryseobacterium sp. Tr-659 TaxID=2608340 RepID=UPI00141EBAD0|nr:hypothetical protein [Chryseobacterium sp. Tr-659]